ncbi:CHAT domain-containing protein [Leptothoe sp. PORK10 BA2]|uniref:CHAT domain-containing protein n=1 Tax=Leptothoe sp. PORK10 BA2 TaxID=3110254 RepID=UPI002B20BB04|nr:CHAT domain-containing protein [Leptothoe sp. PORK10 BA2]MEA5464415.1 CHAT domain-containing protein [Leptothoe sp. PORK10 BA2]
MSPFVGSPDRWGSTDSTTFQSATARAFSTDDDDILPPLPTTTKNNHSPVAQATLSLLQDGIRHYQAEQFAAAIQSWTQALTNAATQDLHQALLLSNLSLAHQHLGQLDQATDAIHQSLHILKTLAHTSPSADYWETIAKALNARGRLEWTQGDTQSALATWQETTAAYERAGHDHGIVLSLINQAKALQTLGLHLRSKTILEQQVYQRLQNSQLDPTLRAAGLWHLGNAQRQFGQLLDAQSYLRQSLDIIQANHLDTLRGPVLMDLGNAERALGDGTSAIGKIAAAAHRESALQAYGEVAAGDYAPMTQLQAQVNQLSLLIDLEKWSEAEALWPQIWFRILPPTGTATALSPSRTAIYTQLNFAKSLVRLMVMADIPHQGRKQATEPVSPLPTTIASTLATSADIDTLLINAAQQADALADPIAKSYALGQRGELYELNADWPKAQALTQKALQLTITNDYPNGRYRWQWQQGRLFKQQQQPDKAIASYQGAVETLSLVRQDLLFIDAEVQFSFRDNVEPVYRELVELLLSDDNNNGPIKQNLDLAIQQIDNLQLSELENFLRCSLGTTAPINQFEAAANTAILYPIILENRLGVISQIQGQKRFTSFPMDQATVEATLKQLQTDLSVAPNRTPKVIKTAQLVYDWLIRPLEADLERNQIETLVFVLDGSLRNVPMAVLHNGQQYLLEKYTIAIAPELELFKPTPLPPDLKVFTGGVGQPQSIEGRNFSAIEKLDAELDAVSQLFGPQPPITNEDFNGMTLQEQLSTGNFSGIHLKTHGVFSSDPEETFIVAYDELILGQELGDLIQIGSRQGESPIELLVLSACSTATGDNRAILGLAGIAVRAGARSTLSTLWEAQDEPNTKMMVQFYQELKKDGTTRAQALHQAQLALMKDYPAPHVWATYVLVGNWL